MGVAGGAGSSGLGADVESCRGEVGHLYDASVLVCIGALSGCSELTPAGLERPVTR